MGNCQASDAVTTLIEHPNGRIEHLYWTVSARQVMLENPGHYVAVYVWPKPSSSPKRKPRMNILPPSAILATGHCYRLISFEEVLENFSSRRLGGSRLTSSADAAFLTAPQSSRARNTGHQKKPIFQPVEDAEEEKEDNELAELAMPLPRSIPMAKQWRPSLQSISETV